MGGHETIEHGIYRMEWLDGPRGVLISTQYEGSGRKPNRADRSELQKRAHKIGVALTYRPSSAESTDPNAEPLVLLAAKEMDPLDLIGAAQNLTSKFFPGIVVVVPCET